MTPQERAEKIAKWDVPEGISYNLPESIEAKLAFIAAQIEEAEQEAIEMKIHSMAKECQLWYERGFNAAKAETRRIVDNTSANLNPDIQLLGAEIASLISEMEPDQGKS